MAGQVNDSGSRPRRPHTAGHAGSSLNLVSLIGKHAWSFLAASRPSQCSGTDRPWPQEPCYPSASGRLHLLTFGQDTFSLPTLFQKVPEGWWSCRWVFHIPWRPHSLSVTRGEGTRPSSLGPRTTEVAGSLLLSQTQQIPAWGPARVTGRDRMEPRCSEPGADSVCTLGLRRGLQCRGTSAASHHFMNGGSDPSLRPRTWKPKVALSPFKMVRTV